MRQIKVTYRAVFAQPQGVLNPMKLKFSAPQPVEIFGTGENWQARELSTPARTVFRKLARFSSAANGQAVVTDSFGEQLRPWQIWGILPAVTGVSTTVERQLDPDEIQILPSGAVLLKELDDYTHIIHAPTLAAREKIPSAACGAKVKAESFISTRLNIRPTCKACAAVWDIHYKPKETKSA